MIPCFSCGAQFSNDVNALLRAYKSLYDKFGEIRYFYKLETNGEIYICSQNSFNEIYEKLIKPNLWRGAEYSCISEFN